MAPLILNDRAIRIVSNSGRNCLPEPVLSHENSTMILNFGACIIGLATLKRRSKTPICPLGPGTVQYRLAEES